MQSVKDHTLITALRQCWTAPRTLKFWLYGRFGYFHWRDVLSAPTLDNAYKSPLRPVDTPGFHLHQMKVADEDPDIGNL